MVPLRIAERLHAGARVLGLSGGGRFEELVRAARADLEIVSADKNPALWPALREHASQHSYHALCGDFRKATGLFDLIFLDLTGNSSDNTSMRLVRAASQMLTVDGWLVITITPDHEQDSAVSLNRPVTVISLLTAETRRQPVAALVYANGSSKRVTLGVFRGPFKSLDPIGLSDAIETRAAYPFWTRLGYGYVVGGATARYRAIPENRRKHNERNRSPQQRARRSKWQHEHRTTDEYRAKNAAYQRRRRREKADEVRAYERERHRLRRLAAVQSTAAEALDQAA